MSNSDIPHQDLTYRIIGAAMRVWVGSVRNTGSDAYKSPALPSHGKSQVWANRTNLSQNGHTKTE